MVIHKKYLMFTKINRKCLNNMYLDCPVPVLLFSGRKPANMKNSGFVQKSINE
jgi:hypothetical protein